jgi:hypothetical protein
MPIGCWSLALSQSHSSTSPRPILRWSSISCSAKACCSLSSSRWSLRDKLRVTASQIG